MGDDNRNFLVATGLILAILMVFQVFFFGPQQAERRAELELQREAELALQEEASDLPPGADGEVAATTRLIDRDEALSSVERITINAPSVTGSISLDGVLFDDLQLRNHTVEVDSDELISLLNPIGTSGAFYARDSWLSRTPGFNDLPVHDSRWTLRSGSELTPETPVVLAFTTESGLEIQRTIEINDNYLFTITDQVSNTSDAEVELQRYGLVRQQGIPEDLEPNMAVFEGAIAVVDGAMEREKYSSLEDGAELEESGQGGWVGITTRYWLAAAIPSLDSNFTANFRTVERNGIPTFDTTYRERAQLLEPGSSLTSVGYIFAGAKELDVLHNVEDEVGVVGFDRAYNWGWLWFLVRPFVWILHLLEGVTGHFGLAILALTLLIKLIMFPLANRAYASMAKMKLIQPKQQEIRERYAADQQKQQQAMMELFRKEKINPLAGCLPILPQIPIFFALYQTLFNALEMRHAPFYGWIQDMSARDPLMIGNLFGLLPYDPLSIPVLSFVLGLGAWPIIMGLTMAAQQALNPPPPDPMQAKIFAFLPIVFTFILAPFAAGLVIYWAWNNFLSVVQQYIIMRRHGNETQLDKLIARLMGKAKEGS